jgi:hypothetical protein
MQTLCAMNVHWRKTQKLEFKKNSIVIISGNITMAKQNKKEITIKLWFFFQQQHRKTNIYFPLTTNNKNGQVCPISRLSFGQKKTQRKEKKKKKKGTRRHQNKIGTKKTIDQLQLATCFYSKNNNEQK